MNLRRLLTLVLGTIAVQAALLGCGKEPADNGSPADYLVAEVDSIGLQRNSEIRTFVGDSLYEYIDGGAELYHAYDFVDVSTADYLTNGREMVVDIYRFDSEDNAFGLFSTLRPDGVATAGTGAASFASPTNVVAVKGVYVLMVIAYEDSDETREAILRTAYYFGNTMLGTTNIPKTFDLFPKTDGVAATEKMYAESFLGRSFLTDVYSRTYLFGTDTLILFLTPDKSGQKYLEWTQQLKPSDTAGIALPALPFDADYSLRFQDNYYGVIVAGLKSGWLAGVVGYTQGHEPEIADWLNSLSEPVGQY
ncbi:MAG: DUF6599 family protein [Candidatus Zixiibacteriota bacterium]